MDNKKKKIEVKLGRIDIDTCTLDEILADLEQYKSLNVNGDVYLEADGESYSGYDYYTVMLTRLETDQEFELRIATEKQKEIDKHNKKMESLLKKKNLTDEEKEQLHEYIRSK